MSQRLKSNEPNRFEIIASFKSVPNCTLAHAVHPLMTWCQYERHQAHTWALRLIKADPKIGEEAAACLQNFDHMADGARTSYATKPNFKKQYDAVIAAFLKWKDEQVTLAAAA